MRRTPVLVYAFLPPGCSVSARPPRQVALDDDVEIETAHLKVVLPADGDGTVSWFGLLNSPRNHAGGGGLLQEGFGIGSFYVPNRRLNVKFEVLDDVPGRPVLRYAYDGDGPNITGLKSTRLIEPIPNEASLRVRWTVENTGDQDQWVAPWIRAGLAPGGALDAADRIDVPTSGRSRHQRCRILSRIAELDCRYRHAGARNRVRGIRRREPPFLSGRARGQ